MAATDFRRIGVIGGGAWGTALALAALRAGREALLWAREPAVVESVNTAHENRDFLPGVTLPVELRATGDLAEVAACDAILLVTPAQHLRSACASLAAHLRPGTPLVICAKGIELDSHALMSEAAAAALPAGTPLAVLSGPTFAAEVARGLPTAVTLACADAALGARLVEALGSRTFRPYLSDDVVGSQIGGAVKNVLAIACGVVEGRKLGDNARAALITRGLAEITRLALALGGRPETLMGLSGLGDLTLTCSSLQSRNMSLGAALGAGRTLAEVLAERRSVAEGVYTAAAVVGLAGKKGVDMPLCAAVDAILNRGAGLDATIDGLLSRPFREEGR
ncbi:NAD(P)H-dependent glycerol-3-phosphate dehydrogenase [Azospirillum brasilense]|uniref:NAD(P)H-dependent glycerol-3-phosphate dehydrogenase n=1 Tax=Azospirillum brasilense TaxID=192 RepID=UPI000E6A402B|nr:NAD(P)H-dependent glycerol-3-phosphate dehydrogenase [Azospirillum brasilense]NUB26995.1 NAD(P)H-dependent glycerol-3-phosphate dehydrogenase [Azospirillum brasilense]NUB34743.1 NAD(P)H-dependent glycerol-3-phosphate dehydrogenase [Azospirillum brasilense]RIV97884.1 NAD(P)-dependent glycerol-3-phosphate dehydrogenase [Azospirillum brasilense]